MKKQLRQNRVSCNLCKRSLKAFRDGSISVETAFDHACWHFQKKLYQCNFCTFKSSTKPSVKRHLNLYHKRPGRTNNYRDFTQDHFEEIVEKFRECFDQENAVKSKKIQGVLKNRTEKRNTEISVEEIATESKKIDNLKTTENEISFGLGEIDS